MALKYYENNTTAKNALRMKKIADLQTSDDDCDVDYDEDTKRMIFLKEMTTMTKYSTMIKRTFNHNKSGKTNSDITTMMIWETITLRPVTEAITNTELYYSRKYNNKIKEKQ